MRRRPACTAVTTMLTITQSARPSSFRMMRSPLSVLSVALLLLQETASSVQNVYSQQQAKPQDDVGLKQQEAECAMDGTCTTTSSSSSTPPILDCGVYMAPSTLGEDSNMGMYAGRAFRKDEVVQSEIAIPLLFREWGEHRTDIHDGEIWDRYIWEGSTADLDSYNERNREDSRAVFVPGIGCTINSVMDMNNIESTSGSVFDTAGLHRSKDPGSGAFTPYIASNTTAEEDIPVGRELFASYGDYWIPDIPGVQITLDPEMDQAEDFLRRSYFPWMQEHPTLTEDMKQSLWEIASDDFPVYNKAFTTLPKAVPWKDIEEALVEVTATDSRKSVIRDFLRQQYTRPLDWLQARGYCQDHMRQGRSTIPQAGHGAFATRRLPKGTIVGYSPLIHMGVHGRELYHVAVGRQQSNSYHMYDLILNYSFGHANSTLLLTPYGGMVNYINHQPKDKANVKVQWPNRELVAHKPDWLNKTPEELRDTLEKIGLSFEYVALRDIEEGEEIFMDYGEEWEKAWTDHVKNWEPVTGADRYLHSSELSEDHIRTMTERRTNPYPDNIVTLCVESYTSLEDGTFWWLPVLVESPHRLHCRVIERSDDEEPLYTVELFFPPVEDRPGDKILVQGVPEEGIFLYDKAFSADWNMPNAFRHEIMLPDSVIPDVWLNGAPVRPA